MVRGLQARPVALCEERSRCGQLIRFQFVDFACLELRSAGFVGGQSDEFNAKPPPAARRIPKDNPSEK
jgi:hypothetical protein